MHLSPVHLLGLQIALAIGVTRGGGALAVRMRVRRAVGEWMAAIALIPLLRLTPGPVSAELFPATGLVELELVGRFAVLTIVFLRVASWRRHGFPSGVQGAATTIGTGAFLIACAIARPPGPAVERATIAMAAAGYLVLLGGAATYLLRHVEAHAAARGRIAEDSTAAVGMLIVATAWLATRLTIPPEFAAAELALLVPTNGLFAETVAARLRSLVDVALVPVLLVCVGPHLAAASMSEVARWWAAVPLAIGLRSSTTVPRVSARYA